MFNKLSVKIADKFENKGIIQSTGREVCEYGLRQIFSSLLNIITMLCIGFLMEMIAETVIFTVAYIPLRSYAGGYHASSPQRCWAISALMLFFNLSAIKYIPELFYSYFAILTLIAGISIIMLSPVEDINKPLDDKEKKIYHTKTLALIIIELTIIVILHFFNIKQIVLTLEMVLITLSIMLIIGKIKLKIANIKSR